MYVQKCIEPVSNAIISDMPIRAVVIVGHSKILAANNKTVQNDAPEMSSPPDREREQWLDSSFNWCEQPFSVFAYPSCFDYRYMYQ